jgi:hypothetical protein
MSERRFQGAKSEKKIKFCGEEVKIQKMSVKQVLEIQDAAKKAEDSKSDTDNLTVMLTVIRTGCNELAEMSDDELFELPMDELSKLSKEIMEHSGLGK